MARRKYDTYSRKRNSINRAVGIAMTALHIAYRDAEKAEEKGLAALAVSLKEIHDWLSVVIEPCIKEEDEETASGLPKR